MPRFDEYYKATKTQLLKKFNASEFWYLVTPGQAKNLNPEIRGVLQSSTGLFYTVEQLMPFMKEHSFIGIWHKGEKQDLVLETASQLLWSNSEATNGSIRLDDAPSVLNKIGHLGLSNWKLPTREQLETFAKRANNPYREGQAYRLTPSLSTEHRKAIDIWLCSSGPLDIEVNYFELKLHSSGYLFAINNHLKDANFLELAMQLLANDWRLKSFDDLHALLPEQLEKGDLLTTINEVKFDFIPAQASTEVTPIIGAYLPTIAGLSDLDYCACRLPKMDAGRMSDPDRGLWELWGSDKAFLNQHNVVARDPARDVRHHAVAIDFGTSSTVVATENQHGESELLRIGVRDYYQEHESHHYENPTVLEFLNLSAFHRVWNHQAYRPKLRWEWVRASHEAQASFRDNPGDTEVLASILPRLKQWALRDARHQQVRLTGRQGCEIELPAHSERNPIRGEALVVNETDPLDPIELYAWYLGMAINWRERGLFLKYYLSFPVKYPLDVKNRILASFRRGLQRSFPQTLIDDHPELLQQFEVQDLASEPAAYAAAALPFLELEPTEEGVPYAVFDFGGGTTDFDFGLWRWANDDEEAKGYESVFEHYASSGDNFLGGENLLEHLVYAVFQDNLQSLRASKVQFVKPIDATRFPGSESFLASTQAAQTNAIMLAAKLRPFLEGSHEQALSLNSQLKLDLINSDDEKVTCELALDLQALDELLKLRIHRGLRSFLHELKQVLPQFPTEAPVQLLLAGNGSRSRHINDLFGNQEQIFKAQCQEVFGDTIPEIQIHTPMSADMDNPYAPTSKTGVALGLLQIVPGKNVLLANRLHEANDGQAPFAWYVGCLRRNQLASRLTPGSEYHRWYELGPIQQGVFYLYYSNSPRTVHGLKKGDPELKMQRLDQHEANEGAKLYARAMEPNQIEIASATELSELEDAISQVLILN